jgi:hypothetical protein
MRYLKRLQNIDEGEIDRNGYFIEFQSDPGNLERSCDFEFSKYATIELFVIYFKQSQ